MPKIFALSLPLYIVHIPLLSSLVLNVLLLRSFFLFLLNLDLVLFFSLGLSFFLVTVSCLINEELIVFTVGIRKKTLTNPCVKKNETITITIITKTIE